MDTQRPRFELFEQDGPDQPHRHTGTMQAPDAATALQNARDVFVRRPECTSLWVAPQNQVYAWTSAVLQADPSWQTETIVLARSVSPYEVFVQPGEGESGAHVGTVEARSPTEALRLAFAKFTTGPVDAWWLVPTRAILRSPR